MFVLSYIFYGFGFFIFLHCLMTLLRFSKYYYIKEWVYKFTEITGSRPKYEDFRFDEDYRLHTTKNILLIIELLWICLGIFSSNWFVFLPLLVFSFIMGTGLKKIRFTIFDKFLLFVYTFVKTFIYLLLIINKFYLEINLLELL